MQEDKIRLRKEAQTVARYYWVSTKDCEDFNLVYRHENREWHMHMILQRNQKNIDFQRALKDEILKIAMKALENNHRTLNIVSQQFAEPLFRISNPTVYREALGQYLGLVVKTVPYAGFYEPTNIRIRKNVVEDIMSNIFNQNYRHLERFDKSDVDEGGKITENWKIFPQPIQNLSTEGVSIPHIYEHHAFYLKRIKEMNFNLKPNLEPKKQTYIWGCV